MRPLRLLLQLPFRPSPAPKGVSGGEGGGSGVVVAAALNFLPSSPPCWEGEEARPRRRRLHAHEDSVGTAAAVISTSGGGSGGGGGSGSGSRSSTYYTVSLCRPLPPLPLARSLARPLAFTCAAASLLENELATTLLSE